VVPLNHISITEEEWGAMIGFGLAPINLLPRLLRNDLGKAYSLEGFSFQTPSGAFPEKYPESPIYLESGNPAVAQ
jgi:hypothetical protein